MKQYALIASLLLLFGCASMATLKETKDDFDGTTRQSLKYNPLAGAGILNNAQVRFNATKLMSENGNAAYAIVIVYYGNQEGWAFIDKGESLHLLIDGERLHLSGEGSLGAREVVSADSVCEQAVYPVNADLIRKIADAKEVRVQLQGSRNTVERHFSEQNSKNFKEFVATFIDAQPVAEAGQK